MQQQHRVGGKDWRMHDDQSADRRGSIRIVDEGPITDAVLEIWYY